MENIRETENKRASLTYALLLLFFSANHQFIGQEIIYSYTSTLCVHKRYCLFKKNGIMSSIHTPIICSQFFLCLGHLFKWVLAYRLHSFFNGYGIFHWMLHALFHQFLTYWYSVCLQVFMLQSTYFRSIWSSQFIGWINSMEHQCPRSRSNAERFTSLVT